MTMDTQQWAIKVAVLCAALCIPLSVVGVTVMAVTHDGATIQQAFDYFTQLIQFAIPAVAAMAGLHIWTQRTPAPAPAPSSQPAASVAPSEGTAGA